jgi:Skp family chaperone for outer membrane proteins
MRSLIFSAFLLLSSLLQAQKIASVNLDSVMKCLPEYQTAIYQTDSMRCVLEDRIKQLSDYLYTFLMDQGCFPPAEEKEKLEKKLEKLQQDIQDFQQEALKRYTSFCEQLFAPVRNKAISLCVIITKEKGLDLLLEGPVADNLLIYTEGPTDITAEVIKRIQ